VVQVKNAVPSKCQTIYHKPNYPSQTLHAATSLDVTLFVVLHSCTAQLYSQLHGPGLPITMHCCAAQLHSQLHGPGLPITMHCCAAQLHSLLHHTVVKGWCLLTCSLQHKLDKVVGEAAPDGLEQYIIISAACILQQTPE
jgi:hypothetical protein